MRDIFFIFAFCCAFFCLVNASSVPFIRKCGAADSKCIKTSTKDAIPIFAKGLPELGIESMDPLFIKHIDASSNNLKLIANDVYITGLKNCAAKKILRDVETSQLTVKLLCTPELEGQYEMKGQILILPMEGKGRVHATIRKVLITIEGELGEIEKGGEKYWFIKKWDSSFELKDKADLEFENLFKDNEVLGRVARELIRSSANEIIKEIGPPVVNAIVSKIVDNVKIFFGNVPLKDLVLS